jgi:hypothetical protein
LTGLHGLLESRAGYSLCVKIVGSLGGGEKLLYAANVAGVLPEELEKAAQEGSPDLVQNEVTSLRGGDPLVSRSRLRLRGSRNSAHSSHVPLTLHDAHVTRALQAAPPSLPVFSPSPVSFVVPDPKWSKHGRRGSSLNACA